MWTLWNWISAIILIAAAILLIVFVGPYIMGVLAFLLAIAGFLLPSYLVYIWVLAGTASVGWAIFWAVITTVIMVLLAIVTDGMSVMWLYLIEFWLLCVVGVFMLIMVLFGMALL